MPYKNPEDKRKWEREHRAQRNARRRELRLSPQTATTPRVVAVPLPTQQSESGWKVLAGLAIGIIILGALAGAGISRNLGLSAGPGNSVG